VKARIHPTHINGTVAVPASKSAMQRACALALLHEGSTIIRNPGKSNDDLAAIEIIKGLGAKVLQNDPGELLVGSTGLPAAAQSNIHCGESGLSIRMFTPIAAISSAAISISGEGSLANRPMDFFEGVFPQLGVSVRSANGKLPLTIKGPLHPDNITIDGSLSSQFLTGLLMAFAKTATRQLTITVIDLKSKPYIDLTLQMMKHFGYEVVHDNYERFIIQPQATNSKPQTYTVEADWSSASFLLVAGAIAGEITVKGLDLFSTQADRAVLQVLGTAGAGLSIQENEITVSKPLIGQCKAFQFDATNCPDLFPPLVALAAYCNGSSIITGVSRLAHKESNRALTLQEEFAKMGVAIEIQDDLMIIRGGAGVKGTALNSHHDHRIAMAGAVAALKAEGDSEIENAEAVNKSYPVFYEDLKMLGANVSLQ